MSTVVLRGSVAMPRPQRVWSSQTVRTCYEVLDASRAGGIDDFTDGKYVDEGNDRAGYLQAQQRQADFLIDQLRCRRGERILEVGCGYGRILRRAQQRGLDAVGITLSPSQSETCAQQGLITQVLNYRDIFPLRGNAWEGRFDGVVANGSLEHFVQIDDAAAGRADALYAEFFAICRRLMGPRRRLVTTAIHFREARRADPWQIRRDPRRFRCGSYERHCANVLQAFGGWYPEPGQLERAAEGRFRLVHAEDGTHDYYLTSEFWLRQLYRSLLTRPRVWRELGKRIADKPRAALALLRCVGWERSWNWQFRDPAPMQLWRHTWEAVD